MKILIKSNSCFSSNLSKKAEENKASSIDIADESFNEGGQGKIYEVRNIDGKQVSGLLVKQFPDKFPSNLKDIITIIRDNINNHKIDQCIALRALPLFLFEG